MLDGKPIVERERSTAEEHFLQKSTRFAERVEAIKQEGEVQLQQLEVQRQESAAQLRTLKAALGKSYQQLKAKVGRTVT